MKTPTSLRLPLSALLLAALSACSGGGGDSSPAPQAAAQATPAATLISGRAVDGPLQGATACYDLNDNGACDGGEPVSGTTDAAGRFTLRVDPATAGRHRVVVDVPASAIDADTGSAVGSAFTLRAPASGTGGDQAVFVSPLTTLVQAHMDDTGATLADATALVRSQAGLAFSPLDDFTAGDGEAERHAARVARLVQLTALAQAAELAGVVGSPDRLGGVVTPAVLEAAIARSLIAALPSVAGAAIEPGLVAASGAALQAALGTTARALAAQVGLNAAQVQAGATAVALAEPPFVPGVAGATLTSLRYTDADNWFLRTLQSSAADNVPDAQNRIRYYDMRLQSSSTVVGTGGVVTGWAYANTPARAGDLHWNGSAWVGCLLTDRYTSRVRDAQGRSDYDFCNNLETGTSVRRVVDIGGRSMVSVVRDMIRSFPGGAQGLAYANWGPSDLGMYGSTTFPDGAALHYQTNTLTATAPGYDAQASNVVTVFNAAVAAGGDARVNPSLACNDPAQNTAAATTAVTTLETLISRNPGRPCIFAQGGTAPNLSLDPNSWWGNSTVNLGDLPSTNTLPAGTGSHYTTTASLRVSFAASGNRATLYRCYRRTSDNSPRNCSLLGLGTWSIQTLGDGRVLGFSVQPALAQKLGYARVFVERGGLVYYGYKNPVGNVTTDIRLNLVAANAVLQQLGLPLVTPVTQPGTATGARAATLATLKGTWFRGDTTNAVVLRFGDNGRFFEAEAQPASPPNRKQSGAELGWLDIDPATGRASVLHEVDSNLTAGLSHFGAASPAFAVSATTLTAGTASFSRLPDDPAGIVGMWAMGSATDLSVPHLVFLGNGRFMLVTHSADPQCIGSNQCPPGVEFSEYSYDAATGRLQLFNLMYDTNGCDGAFETCSAGQNNTTEAVTVTIATDGKTAVLTDSAGTPYNLFRIPAQ